MTFIDTHSHIYAEEFAQDIDDVILRAENAGAVKIFLPNINMSTVGPMLQLARAHPGFLYPMLGLHPEDVDDTWPEVLNQMQALLDQAGHPFIAIGEVGLDYYWDRSRYTKQQEVFTRQAEWALHYGLPLMIHTRDAHREVVDILQKVIASSSNSSGQSLRGVFHCFGGSAEEAEELLQFDGFMLGIGGVLTFKKSSLPDVLRQVVPLERIVIETDSPYLAPVPYRGKRNEPAYASAIIIKLAQIYDVEASLVAQQTTTNALDTFPKAR